jgi:ribosome maturation factor RimP
MAQSKKKSQTNSGNTAAVCYRLAQPVADELGLSLWDVRYIKEGASWYLRLFIDKSDADVSINDCIAMSRRMDKILDEADPIDGSYCLEVCSPGIERELTRPEHFELCQGWPVTVKLIRPLDGVREYTGILTGYKDALITIQTHEANTLSFQKKETSVVHLAENWDDEESGGITDNE